MTVRDIYCTTLKGAKFWVWLIEGGDVHKVDIQDHMDDEVDVLEASGWDEFEITIRR